MAHRAGVGQGGDGQAGADERRDPLRRLERHAGETAASTREPATSRTCRSRSQRARPVRIGAPADCQAVMPPSRIRGSAARRRPGPGGRSWRVAGAADEDDLLVEVLHEFVAVLAQQVKGHVDRAGDVRGLELAGVRTSIICGPRPVVISCCSVAVSRVAGLRGSAAVSVTGSPCRGRSSGRRRRPWRRRRRCARPGGRGGAAGGRGGGAVARAAVHPHLARRDLVEAVRQLVQRDVHAHRRRGRGAIRRAADVEHHSASRPPRAGGGEVGERGRGQRSEAASPAGPGWRCAGGARRRGGRCRSGRARAGRRRPARRSPRAGSAACPTGSASPDRWRTGRQAEAQRAGQVPGRRTRCGRAGRPPTPRRRSARRSSAGRHRRAGSGRPGRGRAGWPGPCARSRPG